MREEGDISGDEGRGRYLRRWGKRETSQEIGEEGDIPGDGGRGRLPELVTDGLGSRSVSSRKDWA